MFRCLRCGKFTALPTCSYCGYKFTVADGIYQLTDDPGINLEDGKGIKYLGYDRIGPYYGGRDRLKCDHASMAIGRQVAELVGKGLVLDLGCGDGQLAVPAVLNGCTVIAGDISNVMLRLLSEKATANQAGSDRLVLCRMNALSIPLGDCSKTA